MSPVAFVCEVCQEVPSASVIVGGHHEVRVSIEDGQLKIRSSKIRDRISTSLQDGSLEATCLRCRGVVVLVERSALAPPPLEDGSGVVDLVAPPAADTDAMSFLSGLGLDPSEFQI